jgi:hypothetical protein
MRYLLASIAVAIFSGAPTSADLFFNYEPGSPVSLGRSIDYRNPTETKQDCLEDIRWSWVETDAMAPESPGGVVQVAVSGEFTDDYREIGRKLNVNASYRANVGVKDALSASSEGNLDIRYDFLGRFHDLAYVLVASYEFGSRRVSSARLEERYQALLDEGRHAEFVAACGTHYAVNEEMWAYASIIVGIDRIDETVKRHLSASYRSQAKVVDLAGAEMGLGVDAAYNAARRYGAASLMFRANGGDPAKAADLAQATQANDIAAAISGMQAYMGGISRNSSVPKRLRLAPFSAFGLQIDPDHDRDRFLEALYFSALRYQASISQITERLKSLEETQNNHLELKGIYERDLASLNTQKGHLDALSVKCVQENVCDLDALSDIAPLVAYRTSTLRDPELRSVCLYANDILQAVAVRLVGRFIDAAAIQDFDVFRGEQYGEALERIHVTRTDLSADPEGRFVARLEVVESDLNDEVSLLERVRSHRYEMAVKVMDGATEWYTLGSPRVRADDCPLVRVQPL